MNIFLGHITSCIFWLTATEEQCEGLCACGQVPSALTQAELSDIPLALQGIVPEDVPLHIELPRTHHRYEVPGVVVHSSELRIPDAYMRLRKDVYIASPELTFIQMASVLSFYELILLGCELCSVFVRNEFSPTGLVDRAPICTPKRIEKAVKKSPKFRGKEKAQKALRFIHANTKSPKEIETAVRFCLYRQYGGDGLLPFECNYRIDIPAAYKHLTSKPYVEADFCWPKHKVVVEYDSDLHTGSEKITKDTTRRNILVPMGYKVIGITRLQNSSRLEMDRVAEEVAIALGIRRDVRTQKHYQQKYLLLDTIEAWLRPTPAEYLKNLQNF